MRRCDACRTGLTGPKRHGFVSNDGKTIKCSGCEFPQRKQRTPRRREDSSAKTSKS